MGRLLWLLLLMIYLRLAIPTMTVDATTRILLDTDMDVDDFFAILYLLKQDRSEINLKAITINTNSWTDAGHAVNHVYDILYMMDRDDIPVGVGGEGGILPNGTILPNVGGYLPLIDQGPSTIGDCRYRQSIPIGKGGRLDINTNHGLRRSFLPQGKRRYSPLQQPTVQQVMIDTISAGPTTVFLIGSHTNFAIFLMTHPHLKKNIEHIFVMGGGIKSRNPSGCCPSNPSTCNSLQCGNVGNLFSAVTTNTYAEFNIFCDPFAAYQVIHSGIPITLVPLDATNTIPITREFFDAFEQNQHTYEAQYCFQSLKMVRDTQPDDSFFTGYFMWDSFASGVAVSIIQNGYTTLEENEFAEMDYYNITVITSNEPYSVTDGSNPFFDGRNTPMFNIDKDGVHSGHVQTGLQDPFCLVDNGKKRGRCQDGYTKEVSGLEAVPVLVAHKAKLNQDPSSTLDRQFFVSFLDVLNQPQHSGRFNFTTEFTHFKNDLYQSTDRKLGKPVVLDMDMSAGDILTLIYLLKVPTDKIDLKGILVSGNGWASAATIDVIYDILHMMGRDDILVGLGDISAMGTPSFSCKYVRAIPQGSGGFIDSDTLFGLARNLPRSPRSYTAHNSVLYGAPKNTSHPELRQPTAKEVWQSISSAVKSEGGRKITVLANGPLTNLANIITSDKNAIKLIQDVYVVGGHISETNGDKGNVFSVPSNKYSEFNFFLDPLAAKTVLELTPPITLIPLTVQRSVASFPLILQSLESTDGTPESVFAHNLLSTMHSLQKQHPIYNHMDMFLGEVLGAVTMTNSFDASGKVQHIEVLTGDVTRDGQTIISGNGNPVKVLETIDTTAFYNHFAATLSAKAQSAVIRSFDEQKREWATGDV